MRAELLAAVLLAGVTILVAPAALAAPTPVSEPASSQPASSQPAASRPAAPRYSLRQLISMARANYPGVEAAREAIKVLEEEVFRAKWAWLPSGNATGIFAPVPKIQCMRTVYNADGTTTEVPDTRDCTHTNVPALNSFDFGGVLGRIEVQLGMPLFTFFKLNSAKRIANAGLDARRQQLRQAEDKLVVDVTRAYWGLKLAREILYTIREGRGYIVDAEKNIEKDVEDDAGEYTMTDMLRIKAARIDVDTRIPDAEKLERLTLLALRALAGQNDKPFDVDTDILEVEGGELLPTKFYMEIAASERPDIKILEAAVRGRRAALSLEQARFFPDIILGGSIVYSRSGGVDMPTNAFYNNTLNSPLGGGFALIMTWRLDPVLQWGAFRRAQAEYRETKARQKELSLGVQLDIQNTHANLLEARKRMDTARNGEKTARKWLVATTQNLAAGLAETRDLTDSLISFFTQRIRYLQAMYDVNVGWADLTRAIGAHAPRK